MTAKVQRWGFSLGWRTGWWYICSISYTGNVVSFWNRRESDVTQTNMEAHSFSAGNITENQLQLEARAQGYAILHTDFSFLKDKAVNERKRYLGTTKVASQTINLLEWRLFFFNQRNHINIQDHNSEFYVFPVCSLWVWLSVSVSLMESWGNHAMQRL